MVNDEQTLVGFFRGEVTERQQQFAALTIPVYEAPVVGDFREISVNVRFHVVDSRCLMAVLAYEAKHYNWQELDLTCLDTYRSKRSKQFKFATR